MITKAHVEQKNEGTKEPTSSLRSSQESYLHADVYHYVSPHNDYFMNILFTLNFQGHNLIPFCTVLRKTQDESVSIDFHRFKLLESIHYEILSQMVYFLFQFQISHQLIPSSTCYRDIISC